MDGETFGAEMRDVVGCTTIMNLFLWCQCNVMIQELSPLRMKVSNMHITWDIIVDVERMTYLNSIIYTSFKSILSIKNPSLYVTYGKNYFLHTRRAPGSETGAEEAQ